MDRGRSPGPGHRGRTQRPVHARPCRGSTFSATATGRQLADRRRVGRGHALRRLRARSPSRAATARNGNAAGAARLTGAPGSDLAANLTLDLRHAQGDVGLFDRRMRLPRGAGVRGPQTAPLSFSPPNRDRRRNHKHQPEPDGGSADQLGRFLRGHRPGSRGHPPPPSAGLSLSGTLTCRSRSTPTPRRRRPFHHAGGDGQPVSTFTLTARPPLTRPLAPWTETSLSPATLSSGQNTIDVTGAEPVPR